MVFRRHRSGRYWRYDLDGHTVPGVTTLTGGGIPKPNLVAWSARLAGEYAADHIDELARMDRAAVIDIVKGAANRARDAAALKGSEIHDLAARLAAGEEVTVDDEHAGYVDAFTRFMDDWKVEPVAIEAAVANRTWQYAGSLDLIARIGPNRHLALIDIKTGATGIWPETCLQVEGYRRAEVMLDPDGREQPMPKIDASYGLWLSDDGYQILPLKSGDDIWAVFLHAAHVSAFMKAADTNRDDYVGVPLTVDEVA